MNALNRILARELRRITKRMKGEPIISSGSGREATLQELSDVLEVYEQAALSGGQLDSDLDDAIGEFCRAHASSRKSLERYCPGIAPRIERVCQLGGQCCAETLPVHHGQKTHDLTPTDAQEVPGTPIKRKL